MAYDPLPLIRLRPSPYLAHCTMNRNHRYHNAFYTSPQRSLCQSDNAHSPELIHQSGAAQHPVRQMLTRVCNRRTGSSERVFIICFILLLNILYIRYIAVYLQPILQRSIIQHHTIPVTSDLLGPHERHANVSFILCNNLHIIPTYQYQLS